MPRYKRAVFLSNLEAEKQEDSVLQKEADEIIKVLNRRLPTVGLIAEYPDQIEDLLRPYDPKDTIVFSWCEDISGFLHGGQHVAEILARLHFDNSASSPITQELIFARSATFRFLEQIGVPHPEFRLVYSSDAAKHWKGKWPAIVRPDREHGSAGLKLTKSLPDAIKQIDELHDKFDPPFIIEEYISPAREFSVGVWQDGKDVEIFPIAEASFKRQKDDIKGEDDKASSGPKTEALNTVPANISKGLEKQLGETAVEITLRFGISIWGRHDFRMYKGTNKPICVDVNGEPDITKDTLLNQMAGAAGLSHDDLILGILDRTISRFERKWALAERGKAEVEKMTNGDKATQ